MITTMILDAITSHGASDTQITQLLLGSISDALWLMFIFKKMG